MPMPTARSNGGHQMAITCNACGHDAHASYRAIIKAGKGDVPLRHLKFRCGKCGSTDYWSVMEGGKAHWFAPGSDT